MIKYIQVAFDDSTGNHTLIYEKLWPPPIFNSNKNEKYTLSKNSKFPYVTR